MHVDRDPASGCSRRDLPAVLLLDERHVREASMTKRLPHLRRRNPRWLHGVPRHERRNKLAGDARRWAGSLLKVTWEGVGRSLRHASILPDDEPSNGGGFIRSSQRLLECL